MEKQKSIFAVTSDGTIRSATFFDTKEKAIAELKSIANDRRYKMGCDVIEDTETKFSFIIGWEEYKVTFAILEIPLK